MFSPSISHPNIYANGVVSISYLDEWRGQSHLKGLIEEIYRIMKQPQIQQAVNLEAVYEFLNQKENIY